MARGGKGLIQIEGARELRKSLRKIGDDLTDMKALNDKVAKLIVSRAKPATPVGETGRLQGTVRGSGTKTKATVRAGSKRVPYAWAIHWGRRVWPGVKAPDPAPPRHKYAAPIERRAWIYDTAKSLDPQIQDLYQDFLKTQAKKLKGKH